MPERPVLDSGENRLFGVIKGAAESDRQKKLFRKVRVVVTYTCHMANSDLNVGCYTPMDREMGRDMDREMGRYQETDRVRCIVIPTGS